MIQAWAELIISDISNGPAYYYFFWGLGAVYPVLFIFLTLGFLRNKKTMPQKKLNIPVTVLVSARNEEVDLPVCIQSLLNLDYPKELLQIILVDDRSNDSTLEIIQKAANSNEQVEWLSTASYPEIELKAKARGVACGMKIATGEWVFITDADAEVHPQWVAHSLGSVKEDTGMLGGALSIKPIGILGKIEHVVWSFVQMFNLGMSGWGVPFACVGPNMAIRKDIYDENGGLENAEFSVAEDLALLIMVSNSKKKIVTFASPETTISLTPVPSFRHLLSQQRRWLRGGIDAGSDYSFMLYLTFWGGLFVTLYYILGWFFSPSVFLAFWILRLVIDLVYFSIQKVKLNLAKHLRYLPLLELYLLVILIYLPISFLFTKKIQWMGDGFSVEYE